MELQSELEQSEAYRLQAVEQLDRAERYKAEVRQLRLHAGDRVLREENELRRVSGPVDSAPDTTTHTEESVPREMPEVDLPPLGNYGYVLEEADRRLAEQNVEIGRLRAELKDSSEQSEDVELSANTIPGQLADSVDKPPDPGDDQLKDRPDRTDTVPGHPVDSVDKPKSAGPSITDKETGASTKPRDRIRWDGSRFIWVTASGVPVEPVRSINSPGLQGAASSLMAGLAEVTEPRGMGTQLRALRMRSGMQNWPLEWLATAVCPAGVEPSAALKAAISMWFSGQALPDMKSLSLLTTAMDATWEEAVAFEWALARSKGRLAVGQPQVSPGTPGPAASKLLSPPQMQEPRSYFPVVRWLAVVLVIVVIGTLSVGYTAGLQADPGPSVMRMVGFGFATLVAQGLSWVAGVLVMIRKHSGSQNPDITLLMGGPLALVVGLVVPWAAGTDAWGRWLADAVGLL
ncbi:hypothetical protein J7E99_38450 [Streptomyces sp. ISL-44]|uniref:hypothetical protein n=1 Tax=Streptomyces sp. ISL-44 TaxID=2819184 RepID=UPI001BE64B23|nr:hypothetical protein [Streptomyces sp. ISL-44]MBT2546390.1 hypothetical protein [Streptomyces sp. ISL-44]